MSGFHASPIRGFFPQRVLIGAFLVAAATFGCNDKLQKKPANAAKSPAQASEDATGSDRATADLQSDGLALTTGEWKMPDDWKDKKKAPFAVKMFKITILDGDQQMPVLGAKLSVQRLAVDSAKKYRPNVSEENRRSNVFTVVIRDGWMKLKDSQFTIKAEAQGHEPQIRVIDLTKAAANVMVEFPITMWNEGMSSGNTKDVATAYDELKGKLQVSKDINDPKILIYSLVAADRAKYPKDVSLVLSHDDDGSFLKAAQTTANVVLYGYWRGMGSADGDKVTDVVEEFVVEKWEVVK